MPIPSWLRRRRLELDEDDFREEVRAHLAIAASEKVADGADDTAARYAALREFGSVTLATEATRRVWRPAWLEALRDLVTDIRQATRSLAKTPGFALTVIGVLTLGIGLNAAVFTMLKGMALAPIAGVDGSARLAVVAGETSAGRDLRISYPDYQHLRRHSQVFANLFGSSLATVNLGRGRGARLIWSELVTGNYFEVLGVRAQLGRTLLPSDEIAPGRHPVVVLGDGLWRREFNADPAIVGRTIEINQYPLTVVGVADASFHGTIVSYDVEAFVPVMMLAELGLTGGLSRADAGRVLSDPRAEVLFPHGYLRPAADMTAAAAEVEGFWTALSRDRPLTEGIVRLNVVPFWRSPTGGQTFMLPTLGVLIAMGLLVLTIACANIAGLVLVRGVSRRGELAVRLALGATRARIVRLLVVENLVLAVPGAVLGLLVSWRGIPVLLGYVEWLAAPERIFINIGVDGLVIAFAAVVACGSALAFGFVPALRSSRIDLVSVINEDASPRGAARGRLRAGLVVAQVAVSVLLLVGASLATRSVEAARGADPGFDTTGVAALGVDVRQNGYDEARGRVFYRQLVEAARASSGIQAASLAAFTPLGLLDTRVARMTIEGYESRPDEDLAFMSNAVDADYFRTLRIDLLAGRAFQDDDDETAPPAAIVNRTWATRFWGDPAKAIGKRLRVGDDGWRTVIGVAADVKYSRIDEAPRPYVYLPFLQAYRPSMVLHVRGVVPVERLVDQAREQVTALDANLPIQYARPLADLTHGAFIFLDLMATMLFLFGAAGMGLAVLGTYGLVSYNVTQRTREIGIRMTLGASGRSVVTDFVGRGLRLGVIGAALGMAAALAGSRWLGALLFGVSPTDALSFGSALAIVLGGVVAATIGPAWRAARTDPLRALRHQ